MFATLERFFGLLGRLITKRPLIIIVALLALLALPISQLPKITMDTSNEGFMHPDDPVLLNYQAFQEAFGRDGKIMLAIKSDNVFDLKFLKTLREIHQELEAKVPYLDEVTSLLNVRYTLGVGSELRTNDLLDPFPTTQAEANKIAKAALDRELYKNLIVNSDGTMTAIVIENLAKVAEASNQSDSLDEGFEEEEDAKLVKLSDAQNNEIVDSVIAIAKKIP